MAAKYLEKIKFLIVDDNPFMLRIVRQVRKTLGAKDIKNSTEWRRRAQGIANLLGRHLHHRLGDETR